MRRQGETIILSATDLMRFQGCAHAVALDLRQLRGEPLAPVEDSAGARLIQAKGHAHEAAFLQSLEDAGESVYSIDKDNLSFQEALVETSRALAEGPDYIYQAALSAGRWSGYADFLERVDRPSRLGAISYEIIDTKLKRSPDPKHVLQLALYSDLLAEAQGVVPEHIHVVLGDRRRVSLRLADYRSYVHHLRGRLEEFIDTLPPTRPEPVPACELCRWREHCAQEWDRTDSLCLLPGIRRSQRHKLEAAGVATMASLAANTAKVPKLADETLAKLRIQARLHTGRRAGGSPAFELRPFDPDKGLSRLPKPGQGDLFFDMEGDPLIEAGLEYLFGVYSEESGIGQFRAFWAHDRTQEREATQRVLTFFSEHLRSHPEARIYHYGAYETTALKRLASGHGVGEALLDQLLREQRFVDLYRIVQQGLIASEPGTSLKDLEVFYGYERPQDVATAGDSIVAYEQWRESQDAVILEGIRAYNEADCRSTKGLRDWLVSAVRPTHLPWWKPTTVVADDGAQDQRTTRAEEERDQLRRQLATVTGPLAGKPAELLFELAWYHQREDKPQWWAMFDRAERDTEELIEDPDSLGGLVAVGQAFPDKKSLARTYRYPEQETKLLEDANVRIKDSLKRVTITRLDPETCEVDVKFGATAGEPPDRLDLVPGGPLDNDVLREAVRRVAANVFAGGGRYRALEALLAREPPRLAGHTPGTPLIDEAADVVEEALNAVRRLHISYLPIQGPPGTGKTYVASQAIVALLRQGKRIAVTSNSHKAIGNLLTAIAARSREQKLPLQAIQKVSNGEPTADPVIAVTKDNEDTRLASYPLVAGTAWLLARPEHDQQFDYLFVDEAGQVSLANIVAAGASARNLVLVGDPMQLAQPVKGRHPGQSASSGLAYVLDGLSTVPPERGVFLPVSRRLHPLICAYISDLVYDCRLDSDAGAARQTLLLDRPMPPLAPAGLRFVPVAHSGNSQSSEEEGKAVSDAYSRLIGQRFRDRDGNEHRVAEADILVVTPYNAQVNLLKRMLPGGARVGTVDKFQGQEAPVCLVSMATSSGDELPRDIEFLFSVNRLNVAISRAQALAIVFASPRLLDVPCRTIDEMRLVNALCAVADTARSQSLCTPS
jgi:predicted RecB family nuclease